VIERQGGSNLKRGPNFEDGRIIADWANLPDTATVEILDASLHDAHVVSIESNLLDRAVSLTCDIWHLREFYHFSEGFQFIFHLIGVQSARVLRYAIWPGECVVPPGTSRDEESRIVLEYQAKWREESYSWTDFENTVTPDNEQVLDISDAALATLEDSVALRLRGHLNFATYHEVFLRAEKILISGSDGRTFGVKELLELGEGYWESFSRRMPK